MITWYCIHPSPLGELCLTSDGEALTAIWLADDPELEIGPTWQLTPERFADARRQLDGYFAGTLTAFELPLAPRGTAFQQRVWRALLEIPYGETRSYRQIANAIGRPTATRAVGAANGRNPLMIVVPCHRVIGSSGALTGYAGGVERKRWLLEHERGTRHESARSEGAAT